MRDVEYRKRPRVLVVAGFDQCGGAGVLADIKTLEAHGVYGYAVCTGLTFQNERRISAVHWFSQAEIFEQIDLCFSSGEEGDQGFDWVKIGVVRDLAMLSAIIHHLKGHRPSIRIILDPVMKASSGRDFWEAADRQGLERVAKDCYLLTPNWEEIGWVYPGQDVLESCRLLSRVVNLYLKGGHNPLNPGRDYLWEDREMRILEPSVAAEDIYPKHGSGCVFSSSLTACLSKGLPLQEAAMASKRYIEQFLTSNQTLLGWHPYQREKQ